jgi:hypothetical protein
MNMTSVVEVNNVWQEEFQSNYCWPQLQDITQACSVIPLACAPVSLLDIAASVVFMLRSSDPHSHHSLIIHKMSATQIIDNILGSHNGEYEDYCFEKCDAV